MLHLRESRTPEIAGTEKAAKEAKAQVSISNIHNASHVEVPIMPEIAPKAKEEARTAGSTAKTTKEERKAEKAARRERKASIP